jgi:ribosomal-protein-alanine N-acetyltransferase
MSGTGFILRPLAPDELAAAARLHRAAFAVEAWEEAALRELLSIPGAAAVAAMSRSGAGSEERLLGFLIGLHIADEAELLTVAVAARRQGVGRALVMDFLARALALGAQAAFLEVASDNQVALKLYQDIGFTIVGARRDYYVRSPENRADAHVMRFEFLQ